MREPPTLDELRAAYRQDLPDLGVDPVSIRDRVEAKRRRLRLAASTLAVVAFVGAGSYAVELSSHGGQQDEVAAAAPDRVWADGPSSLELDTSLTARDWVRADAVVVGTVVEENRLGSAESPSTGGGRVTGREVRLDVDQTVWANRNSMSRPPTDLVLSATGWWMPEGSREEVRIASPGRPRLEEGHRYVIALVSTKCEAEGDHDWRVLGSDAVVPFEEGSLGVGESEGAPTQADKDQTSGRGLERELLGKPLAFLEAILRSQPARTPASECRS